VKNSDDSKRNRRGSHIVTILPRGEAIRNFVYTGVLDEISREAKVTLLSVVPNSDLESKMREHCHEFIGLREVPEHSVVENIREVLDMAHGRWLWSKAAQYRWVVHDIEANGDGRYKRALKKVMCRPFASRSGLGLLSRIERASSKALRTTDEYVR